MTDNNQEEKLLGKKTLRLSKLISDNLKEEEKVSKSDSDSSSDEEKIKSYSSLGRINLKNILNNNIKNEESWSTDNYKQMKEASLNKEKTEKTVYIGNRADNKETSALLNLLPSAKSTRDKYREQKISNTNRDNGQNVIYS